MAYLDKYCRLTHSKSILIHVSPAFRCAKDWKAEYTNFQVPLQLGVATWHRLANKVHTESPRKRLPFPSKKAKFDKE